VLRSDAADLKRVAKEGNPTDAISVLLVRYIYPHVT
jgi:hypothetical protein